MNATARLAQRRLCSNETTSQVRTIVEHCNATLVSNRGLLGAGGAFFSVVTWGLSNVATKGDISDIKEDMRRESERVDRRFEQVNRQFEQIHAELRELNGHLLHVACALGASGKSPCVPLASSDVQRSAA